MRLPNSNQFLYNGLVGHQVHLVAGDVAPDGDNVVDDVDFQRAPVGSTYWKKVTDNQVELYLKAKNDGRDDDWVLIQGVISQRVSYTDFTDGGSTVGTKNLNATIPAGSYFEKTLYTNITGFTGNVSATLTIGDGTDVDRYNTGTPSIFTTDTTVDAGVPSGTRYHDSAVSTVKATATSSTDFTSVAAGAVTITMFYYGSAE